ncbi:MAG: methyltransferase domain-containing protein [Chloroflexota bacterium]|nr:methyltransferase domain-containing protein [Chloroflexota bacterium]
MSDQRDASQQTSDHYFINQELVEEMVRLNRQGRILTEGMGGVLLEQQDLSGIRDILDLACGPGEWAMRVAREYPDKHVVGVDLSERMIEYACVQTEADDISNATFHVMDITRPLDFPDSSFDLINARLLQGFMRKEGWPKLLLECQRLLRPGGMLRLTEQETILTNSPVFERWTSWWYQAFQQAGLAFSRPGQQHIGVTIALKPLLSQAGFVTPQHTAHAIDFSTGTPAHASALENLSDALKLAMPFLARLGVATNEQVKEVLAQMQELAGKEDFCGYWYFLTIWARKP